MLLKPILDGLRGRFDVSVSEVEFQDTWQRCVLGIALVSGDVVVVENLAAQVERFLWNATDTEVVHVEHHWLELDR